MKKYGKWIKDFIIITGITLIISMAIHFFLVPSGVSVSSVTGLAMVLHAFVPLSISMLTMIINVGLLVAGYFLIDPEFCKRTVITSIETPLFLALLEQVCPNPASITGEPFLDVLGYIFIIGWGVSTLIMMNASSGGMDIVAKIMSKYLHMDFGNASSVAGVMVALSSVFSATPRIVFLSILGTYLQGMVLDYFIFGRHAKKRICILSRKEEEITQFLLHELHSGATIYNAIGAYNEEPRREIVAVVDRTEYVKLMTFLSKTDPDAFVTVVAVKEVLYRPKV